MKHSGTANQLLNCRFSPTVSQSNAITNPRHLVRFKAQSVGRAFSWPQLRAESHEVELQPPS